MDRTHSCGELSKKAIGQTVVLAGWVCRRRDHGGLIFIDLRDRWGITQVKFDPLSSRAAWGVAEKIRAEDVLKIQGKVAGRPLEMVNSKIATGDIEVVAEKVEILNSSKTPPFEIDEEKDMREETRLRYRYLDLRRERMRENLLFRSEFIRLLRNFLHREHFVEIETPILTKSTPEGARDYLVPSRLHPGSFYALPQSPQQYKQLLMVSGFDRYFQIARCFRDEDQRGDRQPEFTQLDLEMSFVEQDDILDLTERLFTEVVQKLTTKKILKKPWFRLPYHEVVEKYGTDRPDLRFGLEIQDLTAEVRGCGFKVFSEPIGKGGVVKAIVAPNAIPVLRRQEIESLERDIQKFGAKGLAYLLVESKGVKSPIVKFLGEMFVKNMIDRVGARPGDIIFFGADEKKIVRESLGQLRLLLAKKLDLMDPSLLAFAFIVDFPLFEEERLEDGIWISSHHIFTAPQTSDLPLLDQDPGKVRSWQHDLILNGFEVGGGSLRIIDRKIQEKIFTLVGLDPKEAREKFGHLLEAFEYGAPPHGGIAPGIDRLVMILRDEPNIREVMAFPKTGDGRDFLMGAPSAVDPSQLEELHLRVVNRRS